MSDRQNEEHSASTAVTAQPYNVLHQYSAELLKCLDEMKYKRDVLHNQILTETKEKASLQDDLRQLTCRLTKMNESLCDKMNSMDTFDKAIAETERAFSSLVMGSEHLLVFMKKITDTYLPGIPSPRKEEESKDGAQKTKINNSKKAESSTPRR